MPISSTQHQHPSALICTLGGKPQIVSFALDALRNQGTHVRRVLAVHLSLADVRVERAVGLLEAALPDGLRLESVPIRRRMPTANGVGMTLGAPLARIEDPAAPDAIRGTFHHLIATLKHEGYAIDLCVTGGPRLIGLQALAAASLLLGTHDHCWHLFTPAEVRAQAGEGALLHVPPEAGVHLVPVPLFALGALFPALQEAAFLAPEQWLSRASQQISADEVQRCRAVWNRLKPRQRVVLHAYAQSAGSMAEVAAQLHLSPATVNSHKSVIVAECRIAWGLDKAVRLPASFLREKFGLLPPAFWD